MTDDVMARPTGPIKIAPKCDFLFRNAVFFIKPVRAVVYFDNLFRCEYPGCSGKHLFEGDPYFDVVVVGPLRDAQRRASRQAGHKHVRAAYRRARLRGDSK